MGTIEDLIDALASRRADLGLTQRALDRKIGYAHQTICNWENLVRTPRGHAFFDWITGLNLKIVLVDKDTGEVYHGG
jgi:transcriptional regulator with XRE-family HTH domain